jgi:two-component system chemotaxis response regulator CheY
MKALVVDDSAAVRRIEQKALEGAGFTVLTAGNGHEALARLQEMDACDLIVTDWHMPEMDGMALVQAVRADQRYQAVRILMVTSDGNMASIESALATGVNDFIVKPFSADALREHVAEMLHV